VAQPPQQPPPPCSASDVVQHRNAQYAIAAGGPVGQRKGVCHCHASPDMTPCRHTVILIGGKLARKEFPSPYFCVVTQDGAAAVLVR
jgi:hypothetical protein